MECIKKKICLKDFISRIPGMIQTVDGANINNEENGSWGKIPCKIYLFGKEITYQTLMTYYYAALQAIIDSVYYIYDESGNKWLESDFDWRDAFKNKTQPIYKTTLPKDNLIDNQIIGITPYVRLLNEDIPSLIGTNNNLFTFITEVNSIIGRFIVPYAYKCTKCGHKQYGFNLRKCEDCESTELITQQDLYVPYLMYWKEVDKWINKLTEFQLNNCCKAKEYEEFGGSAFLKYLKTLNNPGIYDSNEIPSIDIPILLTTSTKNIGIYKTYDVDIIDNEEPAVKETKNGGIVKTSAESQLRTLKKRQVSVDDDGNVMPFILKRSITENGDEIYKVNPPFEEKYIKNTRTTDGSIYFGDTIYSMSESCDAIATNENVYNNFASAYVKEGTTSNPVFNMSTSYFKQTITYGSKNHTINDVESLLLKDFSIWENNIYTILKSKLPQYYPEILCAKQEYSLTYKLYYGITDTNGNIITKEEIVERKGYVYVMYHEPKVTIIYTIGAKFKLTGTGQLSLNETNPFNLLESEYHTWDGNGIWYRETLPIKKLCQNTYKVNNKNLTLTYDEINLEGKEQTLSFPGIDFPKQNYILCEEVMYRANAWEDDKTNDAIFRDEKMGGLDYPLKEKYEVAFDRGMSAAYEKHLQLGEIRTWKDLENYRNGMFLNK